MGYVKQYIMINLYRMRRREEAFTRTRHVAPPAIAKNLINTEC